MDSTVIFDPIFEVSILRVIGKAQIRDIIQQNLSLESLHPVQVTQQQPSKSATLPTSLTQYEPTLSTNSELYYPLDDSGLLSNYKDCSNYELISNSTQVVDNLLELDSPQECQPVVQPEIREEQHAITPHWPPEILSVADEKALVPPDTYLKSSQTELTKTSKTASLTGTNTTANIPTPAKLVHSLSSTAYERHQNFFGIIVSECDETSSLDSFMTTATNPAQFHSSMALDYEILGDRRLPSKFAATSPNVATDHQEPRNLCDIVQIQTPTPSELDNPYQTDDLLTWDNDDRTLCCQQLSKMCGINAGQIPELRRQIRIKILAQMTTYLMENVELPLEYPTHVSNWRSDVELNYLVDKFIDQIVTHVLNQRKMKLKQLCLVKLYKLFTRHQTSVYMLMLQMMLERFSLKPLTQTPPGRIQSTSLHSSICHLADHLVSQIISTRFPTVVGSFHKIQASASELLGLYSLDLLQEICPIAMCEILKNKKYLSQSLDNLYASCLLNSDSKLYKGDEVHSLEDLSSKLFVKTDYSQISSSQDLHPKIVNYFISNLNNTNLYSTFNTNLSMGFTKSECLTERFSDVLRFGRNRKTSSTGTISVKQPSAHVMNVILDEDLQSLGQKDDSESKQAELKKRCSELNDTVMYDLSEDKRTNQATPTNCILISGATDLLPADKPTIQACESCKHLHACLNDRDYEPFEMESEHSTDTLHSVESPCESRQPDIVSPQIQDSAIPELGQPKTGGCPNPLISRIIRSQLNDHIVTFMESMCPKCASLTFKFLSANHPLGKLFQSVLDKNGLQSKEEMAVQCDLIKPTGPRESETGANEHRDSENGSTRFINYVAEKVPVKGWSLSNLLKEYGDLEPDAIQTPQLSDGLGSRIAELNYQSQANLLSTDKSLSMTRSDDQTIRVSLASDYRNESHSMDQSQVSTQTCRNNKTDPQREVCDPNGSPKPNRTPSEQEQSVYEDAAECKAQESLQSNVPSMVVENLPPPAAVSAGMGENQGEGPSVQEGLTTRESSLTQNAVEVPKVECKPVNPVSDQIKGENNEPCSATDPFYADTSELKECLEKAESRIILALRQPVKKAFSKSPGTSRKSSSSTSIPWTSQLRFGRPNNAKHHLPNPETKTPDRAQVRNLSTSSTISSTMPSKPLFNRFGFTGTSFQKQPTLKPSRMRRDCQCAHPTTSTPATTLAPSFNRWIPDEIRATYLPKPHFPAPCMELPIKPVFMTDDICGVGGVGVGVIGGGGGGGTKQNPGPSTTTGTSLIKKTNSRRFASVSAESQCFDGRSKSQNVAAAAASRVSRSQNRLPDVLRANCTNKGTY